VAEAATDHWILRMTVGVPADSQDHVWIIRRANTAERKEKYLPLGRLRQATAACLHRPFSSSTKLATSSATGATQARGTTGPSRTTAFLSIKR
jgi:hypothetical protein